MPSYRIVIDTKSQTRKEKEKEQLENVSNGSNNEKESTDDDKKVVTKKKIIKFANGLDDRNYATKIMNAVLAIISGNYPPKNSNIKYPVRLKNSEMIIQEANNVSIDRKLLDFRVDWGITDIISSAQMREMFSHHKNFLVLSVAILIGVLSVIFIPKQFILVSAILLALLFLYVCQNKLEKSN